MLDQLRDVVVHGAPLGGLQPGFLDVLHSLRGIAFFGIGEVGADNVEKELCGIRVQGDRMADAAEVGRYVRNGAEIAGLAFGQKKQLVEKLERGRRRLMDTCDDDELRGPRQSCLQSLTAFILHCWLPPIP